MGEHSYFLKCYGMKICIMNFSSYLVFAFCRLVEGVFFCVIGGFGFLGNLISILILVTPQVLHVTYFQHNFAPSSAVEAHIQSVAGGSCSVRPDVRLLHRPHPRLPPLRVQQQTLCPPLQQVIHIVLFPNWNVFLGTKLMLSWIIWIMF